MAPISKVVIDVVAAQPEIQSEHDKRIAIRKKIFLHEIGHALGLSGHSCNAADIMFFTDNPLPAAVLTSRDKETFKLIYSCENLEKLAEEYIRRKAAQGDKYALMLLATNLQLTRPDSPQLRQTTFQLMKKSADLGLAKAQLAVGAHYLSGDIVERDLSKATHYWELAAKQDAAGAYQSLAHLYERGTGILPDIERADYYYRQALKLDSTSAQINYADFLCYQRGDSRSYATAAHYYQLAAEGFSCEAMGRLSVLYLNGYGVPKNETIAKQWYDKALATIARLKPKDAAGYFMRGRLWQSICRSHEAIADFNQAIAREPNLRGAHIARALQYFATGEFDKAEADIAMSIKSDPQDLDSYFVRCLINLGQNQPAKCLSDTSEIFKRAPDPDNTRLFALLYSSLAYRMLDDKASAQTMLQAAKKRVVPGVWPYPIVCFLDGKITAEELERQSLGEEQATESRAFLGICHALSGDRNAALHNLRWVKEYGDPRFYEHGIAVATLNRIERNQSLSQRAVQATAITAK